MWPQTYSLGYGYVVARNDTTQQSGKTPDKEVKIKKNISVFVSGYTETDNRYDLKDISPDCLAPTQ